MKRAAMIAGGLLGLVFVVFGSNFFLKFIPMPPPPDPTTPPGMFFGALYPTGYLAFVKVLEVLGGALVLIPRTRALGLLLLGPVIVNILAFQIFLAGGAGLKDPVVILVTLLFVFLVWCHRKGLAALLTSQE